jgi:nicotinamidase-related amidase
MIPALLIVDMLNGLLSGRPDQRLIPSENLPGLIARIQELLQKARRAQIPVIFVKCQHEENDPIFQTIPPHALRGTWEAEIIKDLTPDPGDYVVNKRFYDGFYQTELHSVLQQLEADELFLAGIQTDCCVHSTGQGAIFRKYRAIVVSDCCDTISDNRQTVGLERFRDLIGSVKPLDEVTFQS